MSNGIVNELPQNWRNYSPGGKRRKMFKIPFGNKINTELRAMGTKRIGIPSRSFSYYMCDIANFEAEIEEEIKLEPTGKIDKDEVEIIPKNKTNNTNNNKDSKEFIFNRDLNLDELTDSEKAKLTPEQFSLLYNKKKRDENLSSANEIRSNARQLRTAYRTFLLSSAEARAWSKYLSGG
jgi:hypothetical protein